MKGPLTKAIPPTAAARAARWQSWARRSLWIAGTWLFLDWGVPAVVNPIVSHENLTRFNPEFLSSGPGAQSSANSTGDRDNDPYLAPGLRSGHFE